MSAPATPGLAVAGAAARDTRRRGTLLGIWFGGFTLSLGVLLYLYARGWIHSSTLQTGAKHMNEIYAPYLGAITLYYWGTRGSRTAPGPDPAMAGRLAVGLSAAWNMLVVSFLVPLALGFGTIEGALENARTVAGIFSWLAAGAIGYYFAASPSAETVP